MAYEMILANHLYRPYYFLRHLLNIPNFLRYSINIWVLDILNTNQIFFHLFYNILLDLLVVGLYLLLHCIIAILVQKVSKPPIKYPDSSLFHTVWYVGITIGNYRVVTSVGSSNLLIAASKFSIKSKHISNSLEV